MVKKDVHINPTFHVVGGIDPYKGERMDRWVRHPTEDIVRAVPLQLDIESTSACNLECPMCFQSEEETRPAIAHMPIEFFKYFIDEFAAKGGDSLKMQFRGEPLVTKDLEDRTAYATNLGLDVRFNTNGTLLTEDRAKAIIQAGAKEAIFSIDSHLPEEYNKIRIPKIGKLGDFDLVLRNVKTLARLKEELGEKYPQIRVSRVDIPETRNSLEGFTDFWLQNGADFVSVVDLNDYSMGKSGETTASQDFHCEQPWQRLMVLADGIVSPCCGDHYQQFPLGQLATPAQMDEYKAKLGAMLDPTYKPGDRVITKVLESEKQEKWAIGFVQPDGSVNATQMKVRNIVGKTDTILLTDSLEAVWKGQGAEYLREINRRGETHCIGMCADCGYRKTVINSQNLEHRTVIGLKNPQSKSAQTKYIQDGGL
jgi:MoaA/NifB/PqqE/SkfB family radical SAM enzyme